MTANVITYRDRSASREIGKALGLPADELDRLAKHMRRFEYVDPDDTLEQRLERAGLDRRGPRGSALFARLFEEIQDLPRHLGQHSGGMVIAQGRLDEVVPLEPASMPGRVVVQWDKDDCADLGIIKVDLLGLGMMAALEDALALLRGDRASRSTSRTSPRTTRRSTRCCRRPTPSASSRSRAARRWRPCRA